MAEEPMDCIAPQEADTQQLDDAHPRTPFQEAVETDLDATENSKKRARAASVDEETCPQEPRPRIDEVNGSAGGHCDSGISTDHRKVETGHAESPAVVEKHLDVKATEIQPLQHHEEGVKDDGHHKDHHTENGHKSAPAASMEPQTRVSEEDGSAEGHCDHGEKVKSVGNAHDSGISTDHRQEEAEHTQNPAVVDQILSADNGEDTSFKSQDDREASVVQSWLNGETDGRGDSDSHHGHRESIDSQHSAVHSHA